MAHCCLCFSAEDLTKSTDKDAAAVRANHPAPVLSGIYYYEVQILSKGRSGYIGLGFSGPKVNLSRLPGQYSQESREKKHLS